MVFLRLIFNRCLTRKWFFYHKSIIKKIYTFFNRISLQTLFDYYELRGKSSSPEQWGLKMFLEKHLKLSLEERKGGIPGTEKAKTLPVRK